MPFAGRESTGIFCSSVSFLEVSLLVEPDLPLDGFSLLTGCIREGQGNYIVTYRFSSNLVYAQLPQIFLPWNT